MNLGSLFATVLVVCGVTGVTRAQIASPVRVEHYTVEAQTYRVAFVLPDAAQAPLPVVIVQHGSSPTESMGDCPIWGARKHCVKTDVFSKELTAQALAAGFAVAVIDAFSELGVSSRDKTRFPNATLYALHLHTILRSDPRFDASRIYYTGFSYGGHSVLGVLHRRDAPFRAIAPVEAGCQIQPSVRRVSYPVLFVQGDLSHYPPKPCLHLQKALQDAGSNDQAVVLEGGNHNFGVGPSRSGPSRTLNGCTDNPVIVEGATWRHLDGRPTNRSQAMETCTTFVGFASDDITLMPKAVQQVVAFFQTH